MVTEVFSRIGEEELHSGGPGFNKRKDEEEDYLDEFNEVESRSKPITNIKKEFFESLEDESLDVDTCSKLTHEWKK
jgi:hypothetical protein